jgi:hypothetical protein
MSGGLFKHAISIAHSRADCRIRSDGFAPVWGDTRAEIRAAVSFRVFKTVVCNFELPHRMQLCLGVDGDTDITMPQEHSKTATPGPRASSQKTKPKRKCDTPKRLFPNYLSRAPIATKLPQARAFPHEINAQRGGTLPENWASITRHFARKRANSGSRFQ